MADLPIVDLDVLIRPVARVRLFSVVRDVLPVDGRAADLLHQIADRQRENGGADDGNGNLTGLLYYDMAREIIATIVPSLTAEERARLTIDQCTALIGLATKQVSAVEAAIAASAEGNGHGATTTRDSEAALTIPSPVSSSASPTPRGGRSSKSRTSRSR